VLVQPGVVMNRSEHLSSAASSAFYERASNVCQRVREVEAARSVVMTLGGIAAVCPADHGPVRLTTVAQVDVVVAQVPLRSIVWYCEVLKQTIARRARMAWCRVRRS
jgi:hypothetical protein